MSEGSRIAPDAGEGLERDQPVVEVVMLRLRESCTDGFEAVMREALVHLRGATGYGGHTFGPCVEEPGLFMLVIRWRSLQAHTVEFRRSEQHARWQSLLAPHVAPDPSVRHFEVRDASW